MTGSGGALRPPALRPGDRVAIVAPASPVLSVADLERGMAVLKDWGLVPVPMPHLLAARGHLAGLDDQRADDLNAAFRDPTIRAVWAARGGYGTGRLLDLLDWEALAADPKLLVGFSDLTALLMAAWRRLRLISVHGPFVGQLGRVAADPVRSGVLRRLLFAPEPLGRLPRTTFEVVVAGVAEGPIVGGNLALLTSLVGTADALSARDAILLVEDVQEWPYRIDRMLVQLRRAGVIDGVAGVVTGVFSCCDPPADRPSSSVEDVVRDLLGGLGVPVLSGLELGHTPAQLPVPLGVRARLDADAGTLTFLEAATTG